MKQRCLNPKHPGFPDYGGRGITVCERWQHSFEAFLADVGPRPSSEHSIDRIDNDRGYEPGNVRWSTDSQQSFNTRRTIVFSTGETSADVSRRTGIPVYLIQRRHNQGWTEDAIVNVPYHPRGPYRPRQSVHAHDG